ncbi:ATP synthase subunit d, mitochondrial [Plecturocebus cupreus]
MKPSPPGWLLYLRIYQLLTALTTRPMRPTGLVADLEKFNALKFPAPEDKYTAQVEAEEKDVKTCAAWVSLSKARIGQHKKQLEKMRNLIPFDLVTTENLNKAFPETKLEKRNYSYWSHQPIKNL